MNAISMPSSVETEINYERQTQLKAAQDLEAYFVNFLLKEMRKSIPKKYKNTAGDTFQEMFDQQLADIISKNGDFGLAHFIVDNVFDDSMRSFRQKNIANIYTDAAAISPVYREGGSNAKD